MDGAAAEHVVEAAGVLGGCSTAWACAPSPA
jgi:hypothetical protein